MDSIVSSALSAICSNGANGLSLADLWPRLHQPLASSGLHLCHGVKSAVYQGLLAVPGLELHSTDAVFTPRDPCARSLEEAEAKGLRIVAAEHLRDCFVGMYDVKAADATVSAVQRRVLERLALASTSGVTQSELAKEFGIKGNNIYYVLRNLETRGLIVRQSTLVRKKEADCEGENEWKNTSITHTNMIYLYRYAKQLSSQQRLEITRASVSESLAGVNVDNSFDDCAGEGKKDDIIVKDFVPAMRAICEKLEEADDKVLIISDVKQALGYQGAAGHRAWRNICNRLKEAGLVEVFNAEVDQKVVSCLRLLKTFDVKKFQPKHSWSGHNELDSDQLIKCARRGQIINQFLELPIEHQVYDMIDAEGPKGITVTEICKRLGLNNKRNYIRFLNMFSRFGIHVQAECPNKAMQYRVWTSRNFNQSTHAIKDKPDFPIKEGCSVQSAGDLGHRENLDQTRQLVSSNHDGQLQSPIGEIALEFGCASPGDSSHKQMVLGGNNPMASDNGSDGMGSNENYTNAIISRSNSSLIVTTPSPSKRTRRSYPIHPCLISADVSKREQRILEWLQEEKFVLTVELHKWLESLEKEKHTAMDRKTLFRTLNKLQQGGHCKCIQVEVPFITNCGRSRTIDVVLHKSFQTIPTDFKSQIHERLRAFDMQSRGRGLSRLKHEESIPILTNIKRTGKRSISESQALGAETMRANGFISARMIRAKFLHNFLWNYLSTSPDWDDALSNDNPHSTCKLFSLDVALKAMPLELFLQVVGSTHKFEDLVELCKRGVALSDLPKQLYKSLMDTRATGRLSLTVDILRRLKLIRLVNDGDFDNGDEAPRATIRYALELKPYIEEPSSVPELDLRPRKRHDFILLIKDAVDIYWKTLEYCYAVAEPTVAIHAFPGSVVPEVFLFRAWASVRVMTADQRAELIKRIVKDDVSKKLSFSDCVKISKDLNLTLEQVIRVYHDKRYSQLDKCQRNLCPKDKISQPISNHKSDSQKRKKCRSAKRLKLDNADGESGEQLMQTSSDNDGQYVNSQTHFLTDSGDADISVDAWHEDGLVKVTDEHELNEEEKKNGDFINQCSLSRDKYPHQSRFSWTDLSDKHLVIQYARYRAMHGARFFRTDWSSLHDLPAPPSVCKRRMAALKRNINFRESLMRLCNLLGERFAQHLAKTQESHIVWDDFDAQNVRVALDEVLQLKGMSKLETSRGALAADKEWSDAKFEMDEEENFESTMPISGGENHLGKRKRRLSSHGVSRKFLKLLDKGFSFSQHACESLAVANAVELLKIVFLSTSRTPGVSNLLAETLRCYSEHDLFVAFNYLREKKSMVGGGGMQPLGLSQHFLHNISSSPFPTNTGKRAVNFASWLKDREKDLMEVGVYLDEDLQCGDIFHLLSLVSAGQLFISPSLPDKGIGEVERDELCGDNNIKKTNSSLSKDGLWEFVSRREKGFPGIKVYLGCVAISTVDALELFKNDLVQAGTSFDDDSSNVSQLGSAGGLPCSNNPYQIQSFDSTARVARILNHQSPWKAMAIYSEYVMATFSEKELAGSLSPRLFMDVYSDIRKAGDRGLSMDELSRLMVVQGRMTAELVVDTLQIFGLAMKVNAYNSVNVVDSSFRPKYFLTSANGHCDNHRPSPCMSFLSKNDENNYTSAKELAIVTDNNVDYIHKVTVLNLPEDISQTSNECSTQIEDLQPEESMEEEDVSIKDVNEDDPNECLASENTQSFRPIFPWINGDGTTNSIVFKGLVRRVLGIVMQNPGIQENDIIHRMDALNPQSCRKLLDMMILDNNLIVRKMHQTVSSGPPSILAHIIGRNFKKPETVFREHFYANPMSASLL